jgi:hypothetical protein
VSPTRTFCVPGSCKKSISLVRVNLLKQFGMTIDLNNADADRPACCFDPCVRTVFVALHGRVEGAFRSAAGRLDGVQSSML